VAVLEEVHPVERGYARAWVCLKPDVTQDQRVGHARRGRWMKRLKQLLRRPKKAPLLKKLQLLQDPARMVQAHRQKPSKRTQTWPRAVLLKATTMVQRILMDKLLFLALYDTTNARASTHDSVFVAVSNIEK
jgi:hypothetical protein